ncbi:MAG: hypothetical protein WD070_05175, partial [Pirellulaceae bacterium]
MTTNDSNEMTPRNGPSRVRNPAALRTTTVVVIVAWTYLYNVLIKEQGTVRSFFQILDTISDDFITGTILTVGIGIGIV